MIKEALDNIFAQRQTAAITATVSSRISAGRYAIIDDAGRTMTADSTLIWSPGSRVTVHSGRIVSGAQTITIKTYEV